MARIYGAPAFVQAGCSIECAPGHKILDRTLTRRGVRHSYSVAAWRRLAAGPRRELSRIWRIYGYDEPGDDDQRAQDLGGGTASRSPARRRRCGNRASRGATPA